MNLPDMVKAAGVIGAGGAGFPAHVKLAAKAEYVLLNGAECEPLLRVDQQLMEIFTDEIIGGLEAARVHTGASRAIIGVKSKHQSVIRLLRERIGALGLSEHMEVSELRDIYPAGDEQVLVHELTGRIVPEASIPLKVGCVVVNSETALNIHKAMSGEPVTHTYLTIAGDIPERVTVKAPVGMPISDVLKISGVENLNDYAAIDGGPMMGGVLPDFNGFITKKSKGFILLKKDHFLIRKKSVTPEQAARIGKGACEQCRMCTDLCPRYLLGHNMQPHKVMRALGYRQDDISGQQTAQLCCECNACQLFSCPANLLPRSVNSLYKQMLAEQNIRYSSTQTEYKTHEARPYRMIPTKRLITRLGLYAFDKPAPMSDMELKPEYVQISTSQHIGAPSVPVVSAGERIEAGQLIGDIPQGSLGAAIHSSVAGTVVESGDKYIRIKADAYV